MKTKPIRTHRAFTLIELMVSVAIIIVLIMLLMPKLTQARKMAITASCASRLANIGTGFSSYAAGNSGAMPQSAPVYLPDWEPPPLPQELLSWPEFLYIDKAISTNPGNKCGRINGDASWHYPLTWDKFFQCPGNDPELQYGQNWFGARGYGMAWMATSDFGRLLVVHSNRLNPAHIVAADAQLLLGWQGAYAQPAGGPGYEIYGVFQRHLKGGSLAANYLMGDGHVELSEEYGRYSSPPSADSPPYGTQQTSPGNIWVHP